MYKHPHGGIGDLYEVVIIPMCGKGDLNTLYLFPCVVKGSCTVTG